MRIGYRLILQNTETINLIFLHAYYILSSFKCVRQVFTAQYLKFVPEFPFAVLCTEGVAGYSCDPGFMMVNQRFIQELVLALEDCKML